MLMLLARLLLQALDKLVRMPKPQRSSQGEQEVALLEELSALVMNMLPSADPLRLVDLLHSFAHLGHNPGQGQKGLTEICSQLRNRVLPVLVQSDSELLIINLLWTVSRFTHQGVLRADEELFITLAPLLTPRLHLMQFSKLAKLAQAFAGMRINSWVLMDGISRAAYNKIHAQDFDPASVTNILSAMAQLGIQNETFFGAIAHRLQTQPQLFRAQHMVTCIKALATLRYDNEVWSFGQQQLSNRMLLTACSRHMTLNMES
ncbi:uncharacterized protein HaLaN_16196 [Haematococcus lacustris]|uniref:RNA-editing substrate-binding complex 6 protein domain-containing protein n=1 Tax=Haematococcus lacustris TaxID=44745 RepID=A0A699ZC14_HAELA|nr:uncharacterized protein HaLaN_16196 [Haematococcus lacustris]